MVLRHVPARRRGRRTQHPSRDGAHRRGGRLDHPVGQMVTTAAALGLSGR